MKYKVQVTATVYRKYKLICIRCGKEKTMQQPIELPIPNVTRTLGKPSWLKCLTGQHYFYPEGVLEKNE